MRGDVFGREGDFTTSPEISQVFGEVGTASFCVALSGDDDVITAPCNLGRG